MGEVMIQTLTILALTILVALYLAGVIVSVSFGLANCPWLPEWKVLAASLAWPWTVVCEWWRE